MLPARLGIHRCKDDPKRTGPPEEATVPAIADRTGHRPKGLVLGAVRLIGSGPVRVIGSAQVRSEQSQR
jgi:hypothetical protein